ncbi:MAG TPA: heparinase II/III family protein [Steroidobacteraceae bacterium]|nr:heparinase II/III family protein [Steroidobacteraceae bacterium]
MRLRAAPFSIAVAVGGPLLALSVVFFPELRHYRVPDAEVPRTAAAAMQSRERLRLIEDLSSTDLGRFATLPDAEVAAMAAALARGAPALGGDIRLAPRFDAADLAAPSSPVQLDVAGLTVPDLYLRAARITGRREHAELAASYLRNWWSYERRSWLPTGLQWNDHALAARVFVLSRFWAATQSSAAAAADDARWVLDAVAASADRLAKPESFTFRTNHGLMQTLALFHVAACFPELPRSGDYRRVARERLERQLAWYLSPEGVVLEHSAGYHTFGVELLRAAQRYLTVLALPAPWQLDARVELAERFAAALRRPDGTLPAIGDTIRRQGARTAPSGAASMIAPISGYAILWQSGGGGEAVSGASQLVATWSHFATEAHRHADDMSVVVWSRGRDWLIGSGYWPYDSSERAAAVSWAGANGPHGRDEPAPAPQSTRLVGFAEEGPLAALELVRRGARQIDYRRQVVQLADALWLILDSTEGSDAAAVETVWTIAPDVAVTRGDGSPAGFLLTAADGTRAALTLWSGARDFEVESMRGGSRAPIGWTAVDGEVRPTPAIVTTVPTGAYAATLLDAALAGAARPSARLEWTSARRWRIEYERGAHRYSVERQDALLDVRDSAAAAATRVLELSAPGREVARARARIDAAFLEARATAARYNETYLPYRFAVARFIGIGGAVTGAGLILLALAQRRLRLNGAIAWGARIAAAAAWLGFAAWLRWAYFA